MPTPYGLLSMKRTLSYANGWAAEMVYCLPSADVTAHIAANYLMAYPDDPTGYLHVAQISDEPWMDADVVDNTGMSGSRKVTYGFALDYLQSVPWPTAVPKPALAAGTTLKLELKFSGQFLTLPARAFQASGSYTPTSNPDGSPYSGPPITPPPPPPGSNNRILVPLRDFVIEWDRVQDMGSLDFSDVIGQVNNGTFLGCAAETLLLEGVTLAPSFVLNPSNPHAFKAAATLKQRNITVGENTYGWNHDYLPNPPGWTRITMADGSDRYSQGDFSDLFS